MQETKPADVVVAKRIVALENVYKQHLLSAVSPMRYLTADAYTQQWLGFLDVVDIIVEEAGN